MVIQPSGITADEIGMQVDCICRSEELRQSLILGSFLRYIVGQALAGKQHQIKEYSIALEVLKKKSDFNPQLDAIVRIHAGRLRKALAAYYEGPGAGDPIVISVPRGSYVPVFTRKSSAIVLHSVQPAPVLSEKTKPVLAVLPFRAIPADERINALAHVLGIDLAVELTRFNELSIISSFSAIQAARLIEAPDEIALHLGADCLISGSIVKIGDQLKIIVEIQMVKDKTELWANSYLIHDDEASAFREIAYIIRKVVGTVTGHFGLLYRYLLSSHSASTAKDYSYAYAVYLFNQYHLKFTLESMMEAIDALHVAIEKHPENALLPNILGGAYMNMKAADYHGDFDPLEKGLYYTNLAIKLDPNLPYNYKSLAWAMILRHDADGYRKMIGKAIAINPNNVFIVGDAGFGHICVGDYEDGLEYLTEAVNLNPYYPWYFNLGFCLYYLHNSDLEEALYYANRINHEGYFIDPLLKAATLGLLGRRKEAAPHLEKLMELIPGFDDRVEEIVGLYILDVSIQALLLEGLRKAGWNREQEGKTKMRSISSRK